MDYTTLKNQVFQKYYFNSYLPGSLGSYESSIIFNYLLSIESTQENSTTEMNNSERWVDDNNPTWYTNQLPDLFFVPKFVGETDQEYIDRLLLLVDTGQNDNTIINAVFSVIKKAVLVTTAIQIINKLDGVSAIWEDLDNLVSPEHWDGASVWSSTSGIQRTLFLVQMTYLLRGSNSDVTTWDYWILPANYTKIEDMVKLYKPPGSTFELRLIAPATGTPMIDVFSNTLIV